MSNDANDVTVVITCCNQADYIVEAVDSVHAQTLQTPSIIVVDDGSDDPRTIRVLVELSDSGVRVIHQRNAGVSSARNRGIRAASSTFVAVLDGDDRFKPHFLESAVDLLHHDDGLVAASSWMSTFGVLESTVKPLGGDIGAFLARNNCPAACVFRRDLALSAGGYDEDMRAGFEDWDFYLTILEHMEQAYSTHGRIGIIPEPLIEYRTSSTSSNIASMGKRLELMRLIIRKHQQSYQAHLCDAILGIETVSMQRLELWERTVRHHPELLSGNSPSALFMQEPSYGDGGMAAAVRIRSGIEALAEKGKPEVV
ncbi:glycosyltransferase family 2 protein [Bifidobacterium psychraerophilum]|uniref:Glycosyl transferase family 2 n=1 Tax=Bifidobacterium psychraerophilum TaxID=218140 RepID=A0A087CJ06_9BIFI|nr:glycosyltransferase family A protein [Bifidobacterium psychraerophilum]KFI83256.1 glycosyl transferase family 2 [Bifidobacterium psychraerophilum]PKA94310.1 glycosyl transferase family 2 [Bifidobacterium psychraerophilum DSM 22366]